MTFQPDYAERVYSGVLGKLIGVYLGRPFEGWSYDRIVAQLGEVRTYVHDRFGVPLIVTDDDISGTFTFLRALPDYGGRFDLTPAQIGQTWLNYLIEARTVLWWGGLGVSTEHTAYLRLKQGVLAPQSGSIALNGRVVAEQIGAQIFIDGWAMVAPGDPDLAADLARRAASVSHDGEAVYAAQVLAAMEAHAFIEGDIERLLDRAVSYIPDHCTIYRMIDEIRGWHAAEPNWRAARQRLAARYGYEQFGGGCHIVPNHGLIILALLYGDDDFQRSLMIVNTAGWDTDCNSGNVGCLLGIKNGLSGIEAGPDWRGPVADRLYRSSADGGSAISDAVTVAYEIVNTARVMHGKAPLAPKAGARFHFELAGSVQGFQAEQSGSMDAAAVFLKNVAGQSRLGQRSLALRCKGLAPGRAARVATATFIPSKEEADYFDQGSYPLLASPTVYSGQTVRLGLAADVGNERAVTVLPYLNCYGPADKLITVYGPQTILEPGAYRTVAWPLALDEAGPIAKVGVEVRSDRTVDGTLYLDYLTWDGAPRVVLQRPSYPSEMWRRAWVNGVDVFRSDAPEAFWLMQNEGTGLLIQGTRQWHDYEVRSTISPRTGRAAGLAVRVQGMRRYYGLMLGPDGVARLVKALDGTTTLAEAAIGWRLGNGYALKMRVAGSRIQGWVGNDLLFDVRDEQRPLVGGAVAFVCEAGSMMAQQVIVNPLP